MSLLISGILVVECISLMWAHACTGGNPPAPGQPYYPTPERQPIPSSQMNSPSGGVAITPLTDPLPTDFPRPDASGSFPTLKPDSGGGPFASGKSLSERIHAVGEKLHNLPENLGDAADEAGRHISNAFKQASFVKK